MHVHERVLNDAINYAQKGCAMQYWGMTLNAKQLAKVLPQNLWLELFCPVALGKTVQLTFWVPYLQEKVYWQW